MMVFNQGPKKRYASVTLLVPPALISEMKDRADSALLKSADVLTSVIMGSDAPYYEVGEKKICSIELFVLLI